MHIPACRGEKQWRTFLLHLKPLKRQNNATCIFLPAEATSSGTLSCFPPNHQIGKTVSCAYSCLQRREAVAHFPASRQTTKLAKQCHVHILACRSEKQWHTFLLPAKPPNWQNSVMCIFLPAEARSSGTLSCFPPNHQIGKTVLYAYSCLRRQQAVARFPASHQTTKRQNSVMCIFLPAEARRSGALSCFTPNHQIGKTVSCAYSCLQRQNAVARFPASH